MLNNNIKRMISFVLAVTLAMGLVPAVAPAASATENTVTAADYAGKKISILGDSISTYEGVSNDATSNSTIGRNGIHYKVGMAGIYRADTWWQQVIDVLDAELLVNNSWTGSRILTARAGPAAYIDRCVQLHNDTGDTDVDPDVILSFMGTNDFSYGTNEWGSLEEVDRDTLIVKGEDGTYTYPVTPTTVYEAYTIMLHKMRTRYPDTEIYIMGLLARRNPEYAASDVDGMQPTELNKNIKALAESFDCIYVDMESCISSDPADFDLCMYDKRVHPNKLGMDRMTQAVVSAMLEQDATIYEVQSMLTDVTTSNEKNIVLGGNAYQTTLTMGAGMDEMKVTVTMGGEDITASCYSDGVVSIAEVTGDVVITASATGPMVFRWEYNSANNSLLNVSTEGYTANALSMTAGSITDGVLTNATYKMAKPFVLKHDEEWIIEWRSSGDWTGMMLISDSNCGTYMYRNASRLMAFGTRQSGVYHNYGIMMTNADIDWTETHTWCMENRVAEDGSNMVYLLIDNVEIGAMNNHYQGSALKDTDNDWLNGQDLTFGYLGNSGLALNNLHLDYLQIWTEGTDEHRHTYELTSEVKGTCSTAGSKIYTCTECGESYTEETGVDTDNHQKVGAWIYADGKLTGNCTECGETVSKDMVAYRWEVQNDELVSVTTDGNTENALTEKAGTITDGVISGGIYSIGTPVKLSHDQEWVIEWKASGDWTGMLLNQGTGSYMFRNVRKLVAFGRSSGGFHNYGIMMAADAYDWTQSHTWRMENRIAEDGSNMVYLVIDGEEICPMNHYYYPGSTDTGETKEWLNGQDLTYNAIGATGAEFSINNMALEYLQIWTNGAPHQHSYQAAGTTEGTCSKEGYITYTCSCGDSYQESTGEFGDHVYGAWLLVDGQLRRDCTECDAFETKDMVAYRWEMNNAKDDLVSVTTDGNTENVLSEKKGTITNGNLTNVGYKLGSPIVLEPNNEWVIEWKSSGDWNGLLLSTSNDTTVSDITYLFRRASSDLLCLGYSSNYYNYGIVTTDLIDITQAHTFRLENRVAADGSNMVYLVVDGVELGKMNNYWVGGVNNQNTTVDWLNGKTLTFNYIGKEHNNHLVTNMTLEYLQVWTNGAPHVHTYGEWYEADGQMRRECAGCGAYETRAKETYRWEYSSEENALVNVDTGSYTGNDLTKTKGSITNGKFSGAAYAMEKAITLRHDKEWAIEWVSSGDWTGMMLSSTAAYGNGSVYMYRNAKRLMAFGTMTGGVFHNYGIMMTDSDIDWTAEHTWRMENRVNADGSNMVYLIIDGEEIGAMDNHYQASTFQDAGNTWLNGKDLTFSYIGVTNGMELSEIVLKSLEIWAEGVVHEHNYVAGEITEGTCVTEGYVTYTCRCGDSYQVSNGELGDHAYGQWYLHEELQRRDCENCDAFETRELYGYRWEYSSTYNALLSVTTGDNIANGLTLQKGAVSDGQLNSVSYKLNNAVNLPHDKEWIIEWRSSGNWSGMMLSSVATLADGMQYMYRNSSTGLVAFGTRIDDTFHNYGINLTGSGIDVEKIHTWRLENRVAEDGTNMVYMVIDDVEIGAMNEYYVASTNQNSKVDWLSGQDLTFSQIGVSSSHLLSGINLEYLQVWLNGVDEHKHAYVVTATTAGDCKTLRESTYVCDCGLSYTASTGEYGEHPFSNWTVVDDERHRTCAACGELEVVRLGTHYEGSVSNDYYNIISQKDYVLCDGVTETELIINNDAGSRRQVLHVLEVDTFNPNVEILPSYYGIDKDLTNSENWSARVMEEQMDYYRDKLGYNVVAGMNTSLIYDSDAPCSFLVYNGEVLADRGSIYNDNCDTYLAVIKNEDGTVSCELRATSEGLRGDEWHAIPCNFGFTVKDGQMTSTSVDRTNGADRSMIGIKKDGTLMIVQGEGRNAPYSLGLSGYELGETMLALGCMWAVNGDGGGSSQILTKREGEENYVVRNIPSDGTPRATINGIILASKEKADGVFDHVSMIVEDLYISPTASVNVEIKGVDGSGAPADMPEGITYVATGGTFADGVFTSDGTVGTQTVTAFYGEKEVGSVDIHVIIPARIVFDNAAIAVPYGETIPIRISAYSGDTEVKLSAEDVKFALSENVGTIDGLTFTAITEEEAGEVDTAELTATLVYNEEMTVSIPLTVGKGSEVLYDFEDQDLHGWYRSTAANYNAIRVGGDTYLADKNTGHVHSGDYSMAVEMDYSNALDAGFLLGTLVPGERMVLKNAMTIGMWVYFPDEAEAVRIDVQTPTYYSETLLVNQGYITGDMGVSEGGETTRTEVGFISAYDESGWHYVTIDLSSTEFAGLPTLKFYVSMKDGKNGYYYGDHSTVNGKYVFYVDDITVDYSDAVADREAPQFGAMTYSVGGGAPVEFNGNTVASGAVSFAASVAENMRKTNYTGLDKASAHAYIDGADYTSSLTWSEAGDQMLLNNMSLSNGSHTIKFSVCDNAGNYGSIVRTIIIGSEDSAKVRVVPHDPEADRILLGSLYYIDIVADAPETISSVNATLDLNNISVWELEHMEVAEGFKASYTLVKDENIATVTITADGATSLSGEDQILVSIPVRTWELPVVEPIYGHNDVVWMYDAYKKENSILPMDLTVEVDALHVSYRNNVFASYAGTTIQVDTEMSGNGYTSSGSAANNYIGDESWYADWNGGHDHRPETKEYYLEGSTNHVDAIALEDKAATCTETGYTGRTYCEVCQSVVAWGETVPAAGHSYDFVGGVLKCTGCGDLFNGVYTDGKTYVDGVVAEGWSGESYIRGGVKLTGVQKVPSPDNTSVEYYYDFGTDGICAGQTKYTGIFQDGDVYRYSYIGELASGWQVIGTDWYYFCSDTMAAANGTVNVDGIDFAFEANGRLISGVWVKTSAGLRYYYGPGYYVDHWTEIDGELYYFIGGYALTGIHRIKMYGSGSDYGWANFDEDGKFTGYMNGFFTAPDGIYRYAVEGIEQIGLHCIDGNYYFFSYSGPVTGEYYAWETHCDLPVGTYLFGDDYKAVNGVIEKDDGLYYYVNGKIGPAGLTQIGEDYYFVASNGKLVVNSTYYCWATNCDLPVGTYEFGPDGKMLNPPVIPDGTEEKPYIIDEAPVTFNAVVAEDDSRTYYKFDATKAGAISDNAPEGVFVYYYINGEMVTAFPDPVTYQAGDEVVVEVLAWTAGTYEITLSDPTVAKIGDVIYTDLSDALDAANASATAAAPVTVVLVADAHEEKSHLYIDENVTLDMGAYDVYAKSLTVLAGGKLSGVEYKQSTDWAKIHLPSASRMVMSGIVVKNDGSIGVIPVWDDDASCYVFGGAFFRSSNYIVAIDETAKSISFKFFPSLRTDLMKGYFQDENEMRDNGLRLVLRLTWPGADENGDINGEAQQDFVYSSEFVKVFMEKLGSARFTFLLTGYDTMITDEALAEMTITPMIVADNGMIFAGETVEVADYLQ